MSAVETKIKRPSCAHEYPVRWWRSIYNNWLCGVCHPPAAPHLAAEWKDVEGISVAILSSNAVTGGPGIPRSDLQAMWQALGKGHFDSPEVAKVVRRLAFRWDSHEKRWHFTTLTEEEGRSVGPRVRGQSKA
jgi:hypothetical protein